MEEGEVKVRGCVAVRGRRGYVMVQDGDYLRQGWCQWGVCGLLVQLVALWRC